MSVIYLSNTISSHRAIRQNKAHQNKSVNCDVLSVPFLISNALVTTLIPSGGDTRQQIRSQLNINGIIIIMMNGDGYWM